MYVHVCVCTCIHTCLVHMCSYAHLHSCSWETMVCVCVYVSMFVAHFLWDVMCPGPLTPAGVLGHLFFDLSLSDSIEHRRVHHQLEPDTVYIEGAFICVYVSTCVQLHA